MITIHALPGEDRSSNENKRGRGSLHPQFYSGVIEPTSISVALALPEKHIIVDLIFRAICSLFSDLTLPNFGSYQYYIVIIYNIYTITKTALFSHTTSAQIHCKNGPLAPAANKNAVAEQSSTPRNKKFKASAPVICAY